MFSDPNERQIEQAKADSLPATGSTAVTELSVPFHTATSGRPGLSFPGHVKWNEATTQRVHQALDGWISPHFDALALAWGARPLARCVAVKLANQLARRSIDRSVAVRAAQPFARPRPLARARVGGPFL